MKTLTAFSLLFASTVFVHFALGADSGDRPPGVEQTDWIPVSDKLGFVIAGQNRPPSVIPPLALLPGPPPAVGYFMAKTEAGWRRLIIVEPVKGPGATG